MNDWPLLTAAMWKPAGTNSMIKQTDTECIRCISHLLSIQMTISELCLSFHEFICIFNRPAIHANMQPHTQTHKRTQTLVFYFVFCFFFTLPTFLLDCDAAEYSESQEEEVGGDSAGRRRRKGERRSGCEKKDRRMVKWQGGRGRADDRKGGSQREREREGRC